MRAHFAIVAAALVTVAPTALPAQAGRANEAALDSLRSPTAAVRADAFRTLSRRGLVTSRIGAQLHQLLQRENAYLFDSNNPPTSEGYSEYYSTVIGACYRHCDRSDPKVNRTIADGQYNTTSPLALELARDHGPDILPRLFELSRMSQGSIWSEYRRQTGVTMLGLVAEQSRQLTPADRQRIRMTALEALQDSASIVVRRAGIATLGVVGVATDIPVLQHIASFDPERRSWKGVTRYPTRDAATQAIQKINARAH